MTTITGTVHFASKDAERNRYYREGQTISTNSYVKAVWLSPTFVQIDFDTNGRSYVHVAVEGPAFDAVSDAPLLDQISVEQRATLLLWADGRVTWEPTRERAADKWVLS